MNISLFSVTVW